MEFNWSKFTKEDFEKYLEKPIANDWVGAVYVGDICIDLLSEEGVDGKATLLYDFYVAYEDTGYGFKEESNIPYDHADGGAMAAPIGLSYEEFKIEAEKAFVEYIEAFNSDKYNLEDHANRPLEIW